MQIRRLALAAVIIAALAALGWFALRSTQRAQVGLDAAPHADTPGVSPAAPELERTEAAPTRSSAAPVPAPAAPAEPAALKDWSASTPGKPSPSPASGLFVRVLDPESKPLPGAEVSFVSSGPFVRNVGGPLTTGASGYVRLRNGPEGSLDIRASDPEGRYGPAYAFDRHDTEGTIDLRLDATTTHTLLVVDGRGAPVEHFAWRVLDELQYRSHKSGKPFLDEHGLLCDTRLDDGPMGTFTPSEDDRSEHAEGRVELRTGSLAFVVQVDAEEYAPAQAGPFTPATAPGEIRVVLQHLPGIRGRVVYDGKGVAGAWVKLLGPPEGGRALLLNGFPSRVGQFAPAEAECADDGSFVLQLRTSGEFTIQAGAEDRCVAELGPRRYSALQGAEGIELVLPDSGAIEGRLLLAGDVKAEDEIIAASRGDGRACSVHADADGRFRFDGLTPGSWLLRPSNRDLDSVGVHSMTIVDRPAESTLPSTCEVRSGQTTRVEIDLRHPAVFLGELRLPGWDGASWGATLEPLGATYSAPAVSAGDAGGVLRIPLGRAGEYRLSATIQVGERVRSMTVEEELHLVAGDNTWKFESAVGELVLVNTLDTQAFVGVRCQLPGGRRLSTGTNIRAHGETKLAGLPLGKWTSVRRENGSETEEISVELTAGGPARLEWK